MPRTLLPQATRHEDDLCFLMGGHFSYRNDDARHLIRFLIMFDEWVFGIFWRMTKTHEHHVLGRGFLFYSTNLSFQPHATISQWFLLWIFIPTGLCMSFPQFLTASQFIFNSNTIWYGLPERRQICKNNKVTIKPANAIPVTRLKVNGKNDFNNRKLRIIPRL